MDRHPFFLIAISFIIVAVLVEHCAANPRVVYCGLVNNGSSAENEAIQFAVNKMAPGSSNVSLALKNFNISRNKRLYEQASLLLQQNVLTLIEGHNLTAPACALAAVTGIPLIRIHEDSRLLDQCENTVHISADFRTYTHASLQILNMFRWEKVLLLFDEDRVHEALYFQAIARNAKLFVTLVKICEEDSNEDQKTTMDRTLEQVDSEVIILYSKPRTIDQMLQESPCRHKILKWILHGQVPLNVSSQSNNIVVAFKLPYVNSSASDELESAVQAKYPHYNKESVALAYDAVQVINRAVNIAPCSTVNGSDILPADRDSVLTCMKKVTLDGLTGPIRFDEDGRRTSVNLDILNLRNNSFVKIGTWNSSQRAVLFENILRNQEPYPKKETLEGRKLKIVIIEDEPFVMKKKNEDGTTSYEGYCMDLLKELARKLKFTYDLYLSPDGTYGALTDNGTWSGMIGELLNENAQLVVAAITITESREKVVDFTIPFMYYTEDMILKKETIKETPDLLQFLSPFDNNVWFTTIAIMMIISLATFVLNYYSPYGYKDEDGQGTSQEFSFFNSVWFALACMLQQGGDNTPRSLSGRILAGCYWFCILIWVSTYTANLAAFFTVKNAKHPIGNLEDIVKSTYQVGILRGGSTFETFKASNYETHQKIWNRMQASGNFVANTSEGIRYVREKDKFILIYDGPILRHIANQQPCDLMTVPGLSTAKGLALSLPQEDPHTDEITLAILNLHENGFLDGLKRKWWESSSGCPPEPDTTLSRKSIDLVSMLGVYIVLSVGTVIAFLTLLAEIFWKKRRTQIKQRPRVHSIKVVPHEDCTDKEGL